MPLALMTQRDGKIRETWYGRYELHGRKHNINLGIRVSGTPPASLSLRDQGDALFERSRSTAQAKLDSLIEEAQTKGNAARLVEKLYEIKTGETIQSVTLDDLPNEWAKIPRRRKPNARYAGQCQSTLTRFSTFMKGQGNGLREIGQITRSGARSFMDAEGSRGVTSKTWNDTLKLLRATFKYLLPAGAINPFSDMPTQDTETVFRKPFSPDELKAILDAAKEDDFIRPIIVTGMCTAMRRGDCCLLKSKDVDLKRTFITVKTAKTGQTVSIPIFPMLFDELKSRRNDPSGYMFPEQAKMYLENPDGITWRVKKVLATALREDVKLNDQPALPVVSVEEVKKRGFDYISTVPDTEKQARMKLVFDHYLNGKRVCDVRDETGFSKGAVSNYLNEIEAATGCQILRNRKDGNGLTAKLKSDSGLLRVNRDGGKRRASVWDFHSFRVTWVTLALTAGVALELVQKVTGHKTTDVVLKHYFQPGRETFRQALQSAMPNLLTNGQKSPKEEMRELIEASSVATWGEDKKRLLELLTKM